MTKAEVLARIRAGEDPRVLGRRGGLRSAALRRKAKQVEAKQAIRDTIPEQLTWSWA